MFRCVLVIAFFVVAFDSAAAAPPVADYGRLPAVEEMRLSPSGEKLAYFTVSGDTRQVAVRKVAGPVLSAVSTGELKPWRLEWMDDVHLLIVTSRTLGVTDNGAVYLRPFEALQSTILNVDTGAWFNVFHGAQKMAHPTFGDLGHTRIGGKSYG